MAQDYSHELGLLRRVFRGMEKRSISFTQVNQQYLRNERLARSLPVEDGVFVLDRSADDALDDFVVSLMARSAGMERGTSFETVHRELLDILTNYLGRAEDSLDATEVATIHANLEESFRQRSKSRQVFIPCAISPWAAPRFSIGPVKFVYRTEVTRSEFYPPDPGLARQGFDDLLLEMEKTRVYWLACVSVELCDRDRGEQTAIFRKERSEVYRDGRWSGAALNVARSLMASDHAKRKAQLSEQHKRERDVLRFQLGKRPTFEQFLIARGEQQLAKAWRYRQTHVEQAVLSGESYEQPLKHDIRDFVVIAHDPRNGVHYSKHNSREISFTDQGKRIEVWQRSDEATVLAALQLGAQKWGALTVTGPTEFKLLCAELAVKHGIRINNPELQDALVHPIREKPSSLNEPSKPTSPSISYRSHKVDILNRIEVQNPSRLDWMIAVRMRVTGHSQEIIANMLKENAKVGRAAENRDWSNYADRTAEAVFGPRGDRECATNQPRAFAWAKVEGRDLAREQVTQRQSAQRNVDRHRERGGMEIGD
jgi:Large polyvalent protein-associated domain 7